MADPPSPAAMMAAAAEDTVDLARNQFSITLDYSQASITSLEEMLGRMYQELRPGFLERLLRRGPSTRHLTTISLALGGYLGEVIRRRWGGEWTTDDPTSAPTPALRVNDAVTLFPINKVYKRLTNGEEDHVGVFYERAAAYIRQSLNANGDPAIPPER